MNDVLKQFLHRLSEIHSMRAMGWDSARLLLTVHSFVVTLHVICMLTVTLPYMPILHTSLLHFVLCVIDSVIVWHQFFALWDGRLLL